MKIARLPDGSMMEFPPDFPDEEMDRQVRAKLGVPEPVAPEEMLRQTLGMVTEQMAMMQANQQRTDAMLIEAMQLISQAIADVASGQQQAATLLAQGFQRLEEAYRAPRQIVHDKNGKPLGFRTGTMNNGP